MYALQVTKKAEVTGPTLGLCSLSPPADRPQHVSDKYCHSLIFPNFFFPPLDYELSIVQKRTLFILVSLEPNRVPYNVWSFAKTEYTDQCGHGTFY